MESRSVSVLAVILFFLIPLLILIAIGVALLMRSGRGRRDTADETRMIQEIYSGLRKMEERVEALETLLLESEGKEEAHERQ
ncbi:MAG: phage-shock protein [Candidatus Brocadiaceae bacterium]|nr:phage-shock protein [Candidatus Brocadiaceae bacterium]